MTSEAARDFWWNGPLSPIFAGRYELVALVWVLLCVLGWARGASVAPLRSLYLAVLIVPIAVGILAPAGPFFPYYFGPYEGGILTILDDGHSLGAIIAYFFGVYPFTLVNVGMLALDFLRSGPSKTSTLWLRLLVLIAAAVANEVWQRVAFE